ncbi:ABC transporter permease [candidate division KSB1 bacterium]
MQKEFIQIFRNRTMLPIIFVMPLIQLLVLVYAATLEMKKIDMYVVDMDLSPASRRLVSKFESAPFYNLNQGSFSVVLAERELNKGSIDVIMYIPKGFERELIREKKSAVQLIVNAINGTAAGLVNAYSNAVIADYNKNIVAEWINYSEMALPMNINIKYSYWYNTEMNYKIFMLPGILVILVTVVGMFLPALNLVREKEMGTIEQINVTPIHKYQFIIGKLIPFWLIALFELSFGLFLGRILFDVPIQGSLLVLFGFASVYLLVTLGIGLFISTISSTQQQVMFIGFFFMLTFVLMSGIFTPVESMPNWAQKVNLINPFFYFMRVIRMILLKGSGFLDVLNEFLSLFIYAILILGLAIWRYRKTA